MILYRSAAGLLAVLAAIGVMIPLIRFCAGAPLSHWPAAVGFTFSYFTNLTNLLVAIFMTMEAIRIRGRAGQGIAAATLVYILVVHLVYVALLRNAWDPHGWMAASNAICHYIVPIGYAMAWSIRPRAARLRWSAVGLMLVYPVLYGIVSIVHGVFSGWYPYGFMNPAAIGWGGVAAALGGMAAFIALLSVATVWFDRRLAGTRDGA